MKNFHDLSDSRDEQRTVTEPSEMRVVIADSETLLCESLDAYLRSQKGIRVVGSCGSVAAMRDLVDVTRPDVLVLDDGLMAESGLDFLRLAGFPRRTSVVLLMSREDPDATERAMRLGVSACVLKQAPLDDLVAAIRALAAGQMWMSPALLTAVFAEYRPDSEQLQAQEQLKRLTPRESEVLRLMVSGMGRNAIAEGLHVSGNTVRTHTQNIERKLKVHSAIAAVSVALQAGWRP